MCDTAPMKPMRIVLTLLGLGIWSVALTSNAFVGDFTSTYGIKVGSKLQKAKCGLCHTTKLPNLNLYGTDLRKAMTQENTKVLTGSVLKKVEGLDSDKDGVKNGDEIAKDTLPGDPKSK